jgi:hypothetical protein
MVSAAVACLPTAVSLLLLEALFMQISGVSLALTWPCRLCLLRVLLCASHCYKLSPFQAHCGRWLCTSFLRPECLFIVHVGSGSSPSPMEFSSHHHFYKLSRSWLLGVCRCSYLLQPGPACLFTVLWGIHLPHSSALRVPHPLCYVSLLFLLLITQFLFFSLGGGWSVQGAMLIWPRVVCGSTVYCLAHFVVRLFPSRLGAGVGQQPRGPPAFSV